MRKETYMEREHLRRGNYMQKDKSIYKEKKGTIRDRKKIYTKIEKKLYRGMIY